MRNFLVGLAVAAMAIFSARPFVSKPSDYSQRLVLNEENVVIDVAENVSPSVVTVAIKKNRAVAMPFFLGASGLETETVQRDIGTGFIVGADGLIVTNKHVVSDLSAAYKVITKDDTEYEVKNIYRDPVSDLAMIKIEPVDGKVLAAVTLGDSGNLKVGQFVIAIGTALGEFRHTVTTGVISGLGRGITAGDGYSIGEQLDDVIQTDAAINPGNSGGPLLNSSGQVIGVNVAVADGGQNIGFALPINEIKNSLTNFNNSGKFDRPIFGVRYRMLDQQTALLNDVPEGAYVVEVMAESSAQKVGIKNGDIVVSVDGEKVKNIKGGLAGLIGSKKIGDKLEVEIFRGGKIQKVMVGLEGAPGNK
ncbi:MAG: trypsin-like peptidase domain-containing protein [Patescibacteria group bacterium]